jgi:hypothetical protein
MQIARPWVNVFSASEPVEEKLHFLLRVGVLGCFVGHGIWGLLGKKAWLPFFHVFFLPDSVAVHLMPVVGAIDIAIAFWVFLAPMRSVLAWATFWTFFTAFLRPSAGMGMSEFFERAGNFGIPLAFLGMFPRPTTLREWFEPLRASVDAERLRLVRWILTLSIASLLIGHGGLAFFLKSALLMHHFASIGVTLTPGQLQLFGLFEMALGVLVLARPRWTSLMAFVLVYKLATELLHPVTGRWIDVLETVERMGDYVAPLAVIVLLKERGEPLSDARQDQRRLRAAFFADADRDAALRLRAAERA